MTVALSTVDVHTVLNMTSHKDLMAMTNTNTNIMNLIYNWNSSLTTFAHSFPNWTEGYTTWQ